MLGHREVGLVMLAVQGGLLLVVVLKEETKMRDQIQKYLSLFLSFLSSSPPFPLSFFLSGLVMGERPG